MKILIPTTLVLAFMAALTLSLYFPSAGQEPHPAARENALPISLLAEDDVRAFPSDSVSHPFSHSPEAPFLREIEASFSIGTAILLPLSPNSGDDLWT